MLSFLRLKYNNRKQKHFYRRLIRTYDIKKVFDIGANVGKKTMLFLEEDCKVLALEPNSACFTVLEDLKKKYAELRTERLALSDSETTLQFHLGNHPEIGTLSEKMIQQFTYEKEVYWDKEETVQTTTFDQLVSEYFYPDFLKLDCEGWDHVIILSLRKPVKLIEFEFTAPFSVECIASIKHLSEIGNYEFNFSPYEQSKLMFTSWLNSEQLITKINEMKGHIIHGNIYAFNIL